MIPHRYEIRLKFKTQTPITHRILEEIAKCACHQVEKVSPAIVLDIDTETYDLGEDHEPKKEKSE